MKHRQILAEQYEDALFALLMDEVAVAEGARLQELNERLKKDPESAVPNELEDKCLQTINKEFRRQHFAEVKRSSARVLKIIAAVALIAVLLFTTAFAASPSFRTKVLNTIIEVFDDHSEIRFYPAENHADALFTIGKVDLSEISRPFSIKTVDVGKSRTYIELEEISGGSIYLIIDSITKNLSYNYDTEGSVEKTVTIQGKDASLYLKQVNDQTEVSLIWIDTDYNYIINLWSSSIPADDLINLAEHIKFQ